MTRDIVDRIVAWDRWEPPIGKMPKDYPAPEPVSMRECADEILRLRAALANARNEAIEECITEIEEHDFTHSLLPVFLRGLKTPPENEA
jgi:hypothetical protein